MTLGAKMRLERRVKTIKRVAITLTQLSGIVLVMAILWAGSWFACALSTVCYNANI